MFRLPIFIAAVNSFILASAAADDSFYGTYSGECTLNGERMRIELEIVKNEGTQLGGDAILTLSKNDGTSPPIRVTMTGGYRHVREIRRRGDPSPPKETTEFNFRTIDVSETLGRLVVQLTQDGSQLKGTLNVQPIQNRHWRDQTQVRSAQPASVPLVLTRSSMTNSESPSTASSESPAQLKPEEITGLYEGTLTSNKRQFFARLRLNREGANDLSGLLDFSATASDARPLGSFKLTGKFDAANNRFQLSSGGELTSSDGLILATANGNFDPPKGEIRAQLTPNNGILELTRNREKTVELQAKTAEDMKRLSQGPVSLTQARTDDERRDAIVRWFGRLKREYPDLDLHHSILGPELYGKLLNLFCDDDFVPVFGKPFDEMTTDDRNYVKLMFRRLFTGPQTRNLLDRFGDFLERPFVLPHGSFSYADVAPQLAFRRNVRKQWHETMDRLKTLSPTSADYDELVSLEKKGTDPFRDLWPSEFRQFQEGIESTKRRLADDAATDRLNSAMAKATGLDGARSLSGWTNQQKELLEYVSPDIREKLNSRINAKIGEFLEPLLREEADATASLGEGVDAVVAGNKWYRHLNATYAFAAGHPAFEAAIKRLQGRRAADLGAAESTIIAEIEKQSSEKAVDNTRSNYLCVPGDGETAAAAAIAEAANARKSAIAWEKEKTKYSERELALMNKDSRGLISVPPDYEPPTAQEITLATLRAFASSGGEVVSANTATFTPIGGSKKLAYRIQIQHVELTNLDHPDQNPCQPDNAGGYVCQYRISQTIGIPNFAGSSQDPLLKLNEVLIRASEQAQKLNEPQLKKVRFILTTKGWRAPDLESEVASLSLDLR